jgi:hypothetical protein
MADPAAASSMTADPASLTGSPPSTTLDPASLIGNLGSTTITLASTTVTLVGSSSVVLSPAQSSQAAQLSGGENVTDFLGSVGSCLLPGGMPIVIENSTVWAEKGCLPGFYCAFPIPR